MFTKLLLLFIALPVLEITLLIKLGQAFGVWTTLAIVFLTGFAGAYAAKVVGMRTVLAIQEEMRQGRVPGEKLVDALLLFIAGVFLITPGLLSDIAGILLLLPPVRNLLRGWVIEKMRMRIRPDGALPGRVILIEPPGPGA